MCIINVCNINNVIMCENEVNSNIINSINIISSNVY